jgi:isopenicillin-N N-acyltransferase like protein
MTKQIRLLTVTGSPYEMGFTHGRSYRNDIIRYTNERVELVCGGQWSGGPLPRAEVLALAEACLPAHEAYAPDLVDEVRGLAEATGLSRAELLIAGGFTDFVDTVYNQLARPGQRLPLDDCTAVIIPDHLADGAGFLAQTWDMHDTATEFVILLRIQPADAPNALVFTTVGCLGQIGMNSAGIAVGINNLLGADGQLGVTWPFVVRKILQQTNIDDALACITEAPLAGAHNYLLFDSTGSGYNVEAMSTHQEITPLGDDCLVHTNHCLLPQANALAQVRPAASQASSEARLHRAFDLLQKRQLTHHDLIALTRDAEAICVRAAPPLHIESCGAAIMRPRSGDFWAVWGLPSENEFEHFQVAEWQSGEVAK